MGQQQSNEQPSAEGFVPREDESVAVSYAYTSVSVTKKKLGTGSPVQDADQVVTVRAADSSNARLIEPEIEKLRRIPLFYPLLKSSLGFTGEERFMMSQIDPKFLTNMCVRYQLHLTTAADVVSKTQGGLGKAIKNADSAVQGVSSKLDLQAESIRRFEEGLKQIPLLNASIQNVRDTMQQLLPLITQINNSLPADDRLEAFVFSAAPLAESVRWQELGLM